MTFAWSLASVAVAWAGGFWPLVGARAAFGLAQAGAYPVLNKMTCTWFPLETRTTVQGVVTAMGRVGAACAPPLIATYLLARVGLSWQTALLALSVPGIGLAVLWWLVVRDNPRCHPWTNAAERKLLDHDAPLSAAPESLDIVRRPALRLTLRVGRQLVDAACLRVHQHVPGPVLRQLAAVVSARRQASRQRHDGPVRRCRSWAARPAVCSAACSTTG